ncbi:MAG: hypothetical protein JWP28_3882, partial [Phenylobacterium sp.]|uniref:hypothetical protein n=1 Tax=Phenylobacterium sp. TaxID=1871053 RepID=UPI00263457BB
MTIDFSATPDNSPTTNESDSPMFAPVPAWERGKKRRGFGGGRTSRVAEEPRSFASEPETTTAAAEPGAYAFDPIGPTGSAQPTESQPTDNQAGESMFAGTPSYAGVTARRKGSGAVAIAAGIILLGGLGAAGWYYTQPHDSGIAQLTPGSPTTTTTTTAAATDTSSDQLTQATAPPSTPPAAMPGASTAASATPPATTHSTTTTTTTARSSAPAAAHRTVTARARPASRSAADVSADASATAPAPSAPTPQAAPLMNVPPPA